MKPLSRLTFCKSARVLANRIFLLSTFILAALELTPKISWGGACCARSSSLPTLILGDDQFQMGVGYVIDQTVAITNEEGATEFLEAGSSQFRQVVRLDAAAMITDRLQSGMSVPLVNRNVQTPDFSGAYTGIGDLRLNLAYEFMTSWTYSSWKPQGFLYGLITVPTGRSMYESSEPMETDITGNGFASASVGTLFLKRWATWDAFILPEIHYSFSREFDATFNPAGQSLVVHPGFGGSLGLGIGWSPGGGDFRLGFRLHPRVDQGVRAILSRTEYASPGVMASCDTAIDLSYMLNSSNSFMVSYTDQTLWGFAQNSPLSRLLSFNYQHRWER